VTGFGDTIGLRDLILSARSSFLPFDLAGDTNIRQQRWSRKTRDTGGLGVRPLVGRSAAQITGGGTRVAAISTSVARYSLPGRLVEKGQTLLQLGAVAEAFAEFST
jgi:hypothetical protein